MEKKSEFGVFGILDQIKKRQKIKNEDWAKEAGLGHGARISELRSWQSGRRKLADRNLGIEKCITLLRALQTLRGVENINKDLANMVDEIKDIDGELLIMCAALRKDQKLVVKRLLRSLLREPD